VRDLQGNAIARETVGRIEVAIWPDPPAPPRAVTIEVDEDPESGAWRAHVGIPVPSALAARDGWSVDWGEAVPRGTALVAEVQFSRAGGGEGDALLPPDVPSGGETEVLHHTYHLGALRPGEYLFVTASNLGHFGKALFEVEGEVLSAPGEEGEGGGGGSPRALLPFELWAGAAFPDGSWFIEPGRTGENANPDRGLWNNLQEYFFGSRPLDSTDDHHHFITPEIIEGEDGGHHLALRFRRAVTAVDVSFRIQGSADLVGWEDVGHSIEVVEREQDVRGLEEILACVTEPVGTSPLRYLRLVIERLDWAGGE
jgi:hypothetical protein